MARRRDTMGQEGRYRFAHYHMLLFSVFQGTKRANWEDNTFDRFEKKMWVYFVERSKSFTLDAIR